jgi:acylglycerol lipase
MEYRHRTVRVRLARPNPRAQVLLMHGYGDYAQRFAHQNNQLIPKLVGAGFTVCGFDLRGHGNSSGKRAVTDIKRAVSDHLTARKHLPEMDLPVFLLGHSLGGLISVSSALDDPEHLAGMILLAPALLYRMDMALVRRLLRLASAIKPSWQIYRSSSLKDLTKDNTLFRPVDAHAMHIAGQLSQDPIFYKGGMPVLVPATTLLLTHNNWKRYHELTLPTLVIHGTSDKATMPGGSQRFIDRISSADKTLALIDGAYHNLLDDLDRDKVVSLILNWLAAHLSSRNP